ncbi:hypothetical protein GCK32_016596 [Trichostrongylus colubriformis]|uniref:Uncharacterized protein n=1 Tax=Trichostrongylus colubriformis TaxID=6319 RepID=A0AAN8IJ08_TRICO
MVKVKADGETIEEKLKRITWVGMGEQADERSMMKFDMEALREVICSSGDEQLIEKRNKTAHRFPAIMPNNPMDETV